MNGGISRTEKAAYKCLESIVPMRKQARHASDLAQELETVLPMEDNNCSKNIINALRETG